jgi:hypothetical protein
MAAKRKTLRVSANPFIAVLHKTTTASPKKDFLVIIFVYSFFIKLMGTAQIEQAAIVSNLSLS